METIIKTRVGISDFRIGNKPGALTTIGLGSCVGIAVYDPISGLGGLSHIMLPDSKYFNKGIKVAKFADLALPAMIEQLLDAGASKKGFRAKIAGGASMFNYSDEKLNMNIGQRNVEAVQKVLEMLRIPVEGSRVGGTVGRTMTLYLDSMIVGVRVANQKEEFI